MPSEIGKSAKEAKECADAIMTGMGKKAVNFLGEWNELMLYLEYRIREEAKTQ